MAESVTRIQIKAQPQALYRERYNSEVDPRRNRPQRYIRADLNPENYEYPTIEISTQWNRNQKLYIRVTLVTVPSEQVPVICVHPYPIDTLDNVIRDAVRNTLFFPITEEDFTSGRKNFRIMRKKLVQYELKNYGQLRVLNTDQSDIRRIDDPNDARKLIEMYQLGKSQLVFSIAHLVHEEQLPIIYAATTISSNIMTANALTTVLNPDDLTIKCVPKKGAWEGGDEVLMVIPKLDRRRSCRVILEHSFTEQIDDVPVKFVDTKTISIITPPYPLQPVAHQKIEIPFVVIQGGEEIARVNFSYQSLEKCIVCQTDDIFNSSDESNTNMMDFGLDDSDENIKTDADLFE